MLVAARCDSKQVRGLSCKALIIPESIIVAKKRRRIGRCAFCYNPILGSLPIRFDFHAALLACALASTFSLLLSHRHTTSSFPSPE